MTDIANTLVTREMIPLKERRGALTMGLLWLTMVTSFPAVLAGWQWYHQGISLMQLSCCSAISIFVLLLYSVPACELGARTGLGYCALGRIVFGRWGGAFLTLNLLWLFVAWYALTAVLMAQAVSSLFHLTLPLYWLSFIFALLMALNNLFGFSGIANFARFMAAPVLLIWVSYVLIRALNEPVVSTVTQLTHPDNMYALSITSSFIIGFAVWGNEQDYWRYGKPGIWRSAIPLTVAILIGQILFPLAGWFIARASGAANYAATFSFMSEYCFGGIAILGLLLFTADYFSTNDSSLFGCATAVENLVAVNHTLVVAIFAFLGAISAALLSLTDMVQSLNIMVSLNCIVLPTPTIIMIAEWFIQQKIFRHTGFVLNEHGEIPKLQVPAITALALGSLVGIITSGIIPGLQYWQFGIAALNAWLVALLIYMPLRILQLKQVSAISRHVLNFPADN